MTPWAGMVGKEWGGRCERGSKVAPCQPLLWVIGGKVTDPPPGSSVVGKIEPRDCRGTQKGNQFVRAEGRVETERGTWEGPENTGAGP